jgi:hypothetical protein
MKKYLVTILILLSILVISIPVQKVYADSTDLAITSEGTDTGGTYVGGATDYTNLNSDDDFTSYLKMDGAAKSTKYHTYNMNDFVDAYSVINSVSVTMRIQQNNIYSYFQPLICIGGSYYLGTPVSYSTSFANYTDTWYTNPATGNTWAATDINNAEFGIKGYNHTGTDQLFCTYFYVTIDYDPATAPEIDTDAADDIGCTEYNINHTATLNGDITATGGEANDERGFVWDTATKAAPGNVAPAASGYANNWTEAGSFSTGVFDHAITGLVRDTTYYFRACSHNSQSWAYGDELTFDTLGYPDITNTGATQVSATTARLNGLVIDDGGQACDVRFCYDTSSHSANCTNGATCNATCATCNCSAYANTTAWIEDTYTTGNTPYVDIVGLSTNTTYYYCATIRNDVGWECGGEQSFTTPTGIGTPETFMAIPYSDSISLGWVKGEGSTNTLVRFKIGSYPASTADGTQIYLDVGSSYLHEELTSGTTYYYRAWGESGGVYSSSNVTAMATCYAQSPEAVVIDNPDLPSTWWQTPDPTRMSAVPGYEMVNWWASTFEIPQATIWFLLAILLSVLAGIAMYAISFKANIAIITTGGAIGIFTVAGLLSFWIVFIYIVIAAGIIVISQRL